MSQTSRRISRESGDDRRIPVRGQRIRALAEIFSPTRSGAKLGNSCVGSDASKSACSTAVYRSDLLIYFVWKKSSSILD